MQAPRLLPLPLVSLSRLRAAILNKVNTLIWQEFGASPPIPSTVEHGVLTGGPNSWLAAGSQAATERLYKGQELLRRLNAGMAHEQVLFQLLHFLLR